LNNAKDIKSYTKDILCNTSKEMIKFFSFPPNTIAIDIAYTDANDSIWFRKKLNEDFTLLEYWNLAGNTKEKKITA
jgi:hypothetical protein